MITTKLTCDHCSGVVPVEHEEKHYVSIYWCFGNGAHKVTRQDEENKILWEDENE